MRMTRSAAAWARQRSHTPSVSSAVIAPRCRAVVRLSGRPLAATSVVATPAAAIATAAVSPAGPPPTTTTSVRFNVMAPPGSTRDRPIIASGFRFRLGWAMQAHGQRQPRGARVNDDRAAAEQPSTHLQQVCAFAVHVLRSEEHTSELQSLRHLVCRLLLEKK